MYTKQQAFFVSDKAEQREMQLGCLDRSEANTNLILKCIQSNKYFLFLTKLNGGRCSWAALTGVKLSRNGKDEAATIDFRLRLV